MNCLWRVCVLYGALVLAGCGSLDDRYVVPDLVLPRDGAAGTGWTTTDLCGVVLVATGCEDRYGVPAGDASTAVSKVLAGVDWALAERVTIRLSEFEFAPEATAFKVGQPYELVLENDGDSGHTFTAATFFRAIALQELGPETGEARRGMLESVAVEKGATRTLRFVPVIAGSYGLTCERPLHEVFGMSGTIRIE